MNFRPTIYLKLLFAALSIAILLRFAPVGEIAAILRTASIPWLIAGIALHFAVRFSSTFRMQIVARNQGLDLSRRELFRILLATQYYSLFLPGLLGGGATWLKYVQHGAGQGAAAAMVVLNRAIGVAATLGLGLVAWLVDRGPASPMLVVALIVLVAAVPAIAVALPPQRDRQPGGRAASRWVVRKMHNLGIRLLRLLSLSRPDKFVVLSSACVDSLLGAMIIWCFAIAVGAEIGFLAALWVRAALLLVLMIPVTVAGLGLREASLVAFGAVLGIDPPEAIAWSLTILLGTLVVACYGGIIEASASSRRVAALLDTEKRESDARQPDP